MTSETEALKEYEAVIKSLVHSYSKKLPPYLSREDLEQEANIAFIKAFRCWKPEPGQIFGVWAHTFIENHFRNLYKRNKRERKRVEAPSPAGMEPGEYDGDLMDLFRSGDSGPEDLFAAAELNALLSAFSIEDKEFLRDVATLGVKNYIRTKMQTDPAHHVQMSVIRRRDALKAEILKKWSA